MSVITLDQLAAFAEDLLAAAGADREQAAVVAEDLVWSDSVGRPNRVCGGFSFSASDSRPACSTARADRASTSGQRRSR